MQRLYYFLFLCITIHAGAQELPSESISAMVDPCVVKIETLDNYNRKIGNGSGVTLTTEGYVITNYHVFEHGNSMRVTNQTLNRYYNSTQIIYADRDKDILVFKIEASNVRAIRLGNSDSLKKGQTVYAIGSPYELDNSFTRGVVSGFRKFLQAGNKEQMFIQHDAAISPGNSGGALVNNKGELIGINTLVSSESHAQNINYAIPINEIKDILNYNSLGWIVQGQKEPSQKNKAVKPQTFTPAEKYEDVGKKITPSAIVSPDNPYGHGNGYISVWTNCTNCVADVWIDDEYKGRTKSYFSNTPLCGQTGTLSKIVTAEKWHKIYAKDVYFGTTWTTQVFVKEGSCNMQLLTLKK